MNIGTGKCTDHVFMAYIDDSRSSCIAISGLSSHPFGSWQPRGGRKEFMWLRDELPQRHPTMRAWIYGYDTNLTDSTSFQSISDLSISLINHLEASDFASPSAPQILIMAHSLGGIVFKEAISNLARGGERSIHILRLIRGAILFGVPNLGMEQSHLQSLVQYQPNRALVDDLAVGSPYLKILDQQFLAHRIVQRMNIIWAYETRTSAVLEVNPPQFENYLPLTSELDRPAWDDFSIQHSTNSCFERISHLGIYISKRKSYDSNQQRSFQYCQVP